MPECKNQCYRCKYFDRYYIKKVKQFEQTKFGWCSRNGGQIVNSTSCCDKYEFRKPRKVSVDFLKYYLSDLLTEISEMRKTVEAEINENEDL